mgnify:CR=1 FL=1
MLYTVTRFYYPNGTEGETMGTTSKDFDVCDYRL